VPLTTAQRALHGRIGAAVARSRHDVRELTAAGRAAFLGRFERQVRDASPELSDAEVQRRAGELRKAYMLRLAAKSAAARRRKRTADPGPEPTVRDGRDDAAPRPRR
jgi:hypothetical protein